MISSGNKSDNFALSDFLNRDNLVGIQSSFDFLWSLLSHNLNMNWMRQVGGDSSLSSISSSSSFLSLVDLDVGDNKFLKIQGFGLSIVLQVLQQR